MKMFPNVLLGNKENKQRLKEGTLKVSPARTGSIPTTNSNMIQDNHGWTPLSYAIYKNDMELFRFVLSLVAGTKEDAVYSYIDIDSDLGSTSQNYYFGNQSMYGQTLHLRLALVLGRVEILEEIMKTVAFGVPWAELEEADEELQMAKPQFYQGLTVYGVKRKDWASSSYPAYGTKSDKMQKPVQTAVYFGQLKSIKWLLSDRPFQCLKDFMDAHPDTMKTKLLKKQGDGLGFLLQKGLGVETTLLPHLAIKGWVKTYPMETFRFLLSRPGAVDARTNLHMNLPLYAVQEAGFESCKIAVVAELRKTEHGADFAARDSRGRNILHHALVPRGSTAIVNTKLLAEVLELLPSDVMETGWTQRILGTSRTPLAYWLSMQNGRVHIPTLKLILKYSKGQELGIANNEGNLPIHWVCVPPLHFTRVISHDHPLINETGVPKWPPWCGPHYHEDGAAVHPHGECKRTHTG